MDSQPGTWEMNLQPDDYPKYKPYDNLDDEYDDGNSEPQSSCCSEDSSQLPPSPVAYPTPTLQHSESNYNPEKEFTCNCAVHEQLPCGMVFDNRFKLTKRIGKGSFGTCYAAVDMHTGQEEVVIKARVSSASITNSEFSCSLRDELNSYMQLSAGGGLMRGVPFIYSAGVHKLVPSTPDGQPVYVSYIAMQRLGVSVWTFCHQWQPVKKKTKHHEEYHLAPSRQEIVDIGKGMLKALMAIHACGIIHKDVKTDNFCLGLTDSTASIYAIDLGFAMPAFGRYSFDKYDKQCASFWGTPNYASMASLKRMPQSVKDDCEALVYCLLEMEQPLCRLPWNNSLTTNSEAAAGWSDEQLDAMSVKKQAAWQQACKDGLVPPYIRTYYDYITSLHASDIPDYAWLLMVLDAGATHRKLSRQPLRRTYDAWPALGEEYHQDAVVYALLEQLREAVCEALQDTADSLPPPLQQQQQQQQQEQEAEPACSSEYGDGQYAAETESGSRSSGSADSGDASAGDGGIDEQQGAVPAEAAVEWQAQQRKRQRAAPVTKVKSKWVEFFVKEEDVLAEDCAVDVLEQQQKRQRVAGANVSVFADAEAFLDGSRREEE